MYFRIFVLYIQADTDSSNCSACVEQLDNCYPIGPVNFVHRYKFLRSNRQGPNMGLELENISFI